MPQILLAGAPTGCWTNLGDEAILAGMLEGLRAGPDTGLAPDLQVKIVSSNPPDFLDAYGAHVVPFADVDAVASVVAASDLVLLGGGSIFFDYWGCDPDAVLTPRHHGLSLWTGVALLAAAYGVPTMVYGAGVGPLRSADGHLLTAAAFELAGVVTVRDEDSRTTLDALGIERSAVRVTGDPALAVQLPTRRPRDDGKLGAGPVVGVALRQWDVDVDPERWQAAVAGALDTFLEATDGTALFVPCHRGVAWPLSDDAAAADAVRARMAQRERTVAVDVDEPWADRAARLAGCDLVLGMRYHAVLFAVAAGVPVVGLNYDPKVTGLLADRDLASMGLALGDLDPVTLADRLQRAHASSRAAPDAAPVDAMRAAERTNAAHARALLGDPRRARLRGPALGALLQRLATEPDDRPRAARAALAHLRRRRVTAAARPAAAACRTDPTAVGDRPASIPRPRVALLSNRLLDRETGVPAIGGAERYALELARLLRDLGMDPAFFQLGGTWGAADYFGFRVTALPEGAAFSEFQVGVADEFHERTLDVDHVIYVAPNYAAGAMRDDAIVVVHGVWWDHDRWEHLEFRTPAWYEHLERVVGRAARVVSVDMNAINVVRALFPDAARQMTFVANSVDTTEFHPPDARPDGPPTILFPRRADVVRGPELVGPILDRIPDPFRAQWIGDGDPAMVAELRAVEARDDRFRFATAAFEDMPAIYRGAEICVIPTIGSEGQSLACLEAMASGCAVVATRVGGLSEMIDDGVDGLLCDPDPDDLAAAIRRLIREPALRQQLGTAGRARAERHSLARWRAEWAQVLAEEGWVDSTAAAVPYDVVCFSIIDWDFRWQRPQQLVARWAERGRRCFYVGLAPTAEPDKEPIQVLPLAENVWEVRLAVPEGSDAHAGSAPDGFVEAAQRALEVLRAEFGIERAASVVEIAGWTPIALAARQTFGWPVVYDCMDDWSTFPGFAEQPAFGDQERRLVAECDVLVVSSATIEDRWRGTRPDVLLARNAADFDFFHRPDGPDPLAEVEGPIAGFFGALVEWFDIPLVKHVALARPDVTFVFVGEVRRISVEALEELPNVRFLGNQPYESLPRFLERFDVCLVPFEVSPVTDGMDVVKLYEYLSQGKPVVSTRIREIVAYDDLVYLAGDPDEFVAQLDRALTEDEPALVARRTELARQHTWDERLDRIEARLRGHLDRAADATRPGRPVDRDEVRSLEAELARWQDAADHLNRELEAVHRSNAWKAANVAWRARRLVEGAMKRLRPGST